MNDGNSRRFCRNINDESLRWNKLKWREFGKSNILLREKFLRAKLKLCELNKLFALNIQQIFDLSVNFLFHEMCSTTNCFFMIRYQKLRKNFSKIFSMKCETSRQHRRKAAPRTADQQRHANWDNHDKGLACSRTSRSVHLRPDDLNFGHFKNA